MPAFTDSIICLMGLFTLLLLDRYLGLFQVPERLEFFAPVQLLNRLARIEGKTLLAFL